MLHRRQKDSVHGKGINYLVQAADMVGMGMGANHIIHFFHSLCLQIRDYGIGLVIFPCINQHVVSA